MRIAMMIAVLPALALTGCMAAGEGGPAGPPTLSGECKADALASFAGQKATAEVGAAMMKASGARTLRWVPPRTAVTMDFRADRLTVSYDDAMVIERASCG